MSERVIPLSLLDGKGDPTGRSLKIDINHGFVYDEAGNQVGRATLANEDTTDLVADHVGALSLSAQVAQIGSAICMNERAQERVRENAKAAYRSGVSRLLSDRFKGRVAKDDRLLSALADSEKRLLDIGTGDVHLPAALPNYAAGYQNDGFIADVVSPPILVNKPADKYYTFAKEDAFQRALPIVGAPAGSVPEISPRLANTQFNTVERAIGGFLSTQVENASDGALKLRQAYAERIHMAHMIEREIRVQALMTASANYDSSVVVTVAGGSQWDGGASSNPLTDLQGRIIAAWAPNLDGTALSRQLWYDFQNNANVQKYFAYKDGVAPLPKPGDMKALLDLPPFYVANAKVIGSTGSQSLIWGNDVLMFKMPKQMPPTDQRDVSTGATFRWNDTDIPDGRVANGFVIREFFYQARGSKGGYMQIMVVQDAEAITSKYAAGLLKSAHQ